MFVYIHIRPIQVGDFPAYLAEPLKRMMRSAHAPGSPPLRSAGLAILYKVVGKAWLRSVVCCAPVPWFLVEMCCIVNF